MTQDGVAAVLAHGLGGRTDLPLPAGVAVTGGALAVIVSFVALGALWQRPRLDPDAGRPLPAPLAHLVDSPVLRGALRGLTTGLVIVVLVVAFLGPAESSLNLAPWALYVTFWVGLVPASLLLGPIWRAVNPLRFLHALLALMSRTGEDEPRRDYPAQWGYWPAAAWLAGFVWLELVAPGRTDPRLVGGLILGYAAVNLAAAQVYGQIWFRRGDGFEVYSTLIGRLAPFGRRRDGTLVVRNPLHGLAQVRAEPGLVALACVIVGSTAFDGLTRTRFWTASVDPRSVLLGTLGLVGCIALVAAVYVLALRASAELSGGSRDRLPGQFAATLVPIAVGYTIAHYFSFFLLEGQATYILASDPFRTGTDLFGTAQATIDYTLVSPAVVAAVQIGAIVLGHVLGTVAAHDKAVAMFPPAAARRGQLPVLAAMVILTTTGIGLLFSG